MKIKLIGIILLLAILALTIFSQTEKSSAKITLDEARKIFVGKSVKIFDKTDSDGKLSYWHFADEKDGVYKRRPYFIRNGNKLESTKLPVNYRWQKAVIVAIELHEKSIPKTNALGELLDGEKDSPTLVYVFVKFSDDTIASKLSVLETLSGNEDFFGIEKLKSIENGFISLAELVKRRTLINSKINSIVGKQVFATKNSKLYPISSTLFELIDDKNRLTVFPYFEPLTITVAKYNEEADVIIIKLEAKSGEKFLTFSNYIPQKFTIGFFETVISYWSQPELRSVTNYNEKEVKAIKSRTIYIGMNVGKVIDSLGSPEKFENNFQIIVYSNGKLRVYTNKETKTVIKIEDNR